MIMDEYQPVWIYQLHIIPDHSDFLLQQINRLVHEEWDDVSYILTPEDVLTI